jgi:hypothetical protein
VYPALEFDNWISIVPGTFQMEEEFSATTRTENFCRIPARDFGLQFAVHRLDMLQSPLVFHNWPLREEKLRQDAHSKEKRKKKKNERTSIGVATRTAIILCPLRRHQESSHALGH